MWGPIFQRCFYLSQTFSRGEAVCQTECKHDPQCLASFAAKNGCYKAERRLSRDSRNCDDFDQEIHDRHWLPSAVLFFDSRWGLTRLLQRALHTFRSMPGQIWVYFFIFDCCTTDHPTSTASPLCFASFPQVVYAPQWLVKRSASLLTSTTAGDSTSRM